MGLINAAILLLPLLAAGGTSVSQIQPPTPPAAPLPIPTDLLPFGDEGSRMTVPVTIAGAGPYRFVVDTGAQRTVISRELASTLGLSPGRNVRMTAMADTINVGTVVIPMISVGTVGGMQIEAPALMERNLGAPGMLGIDTLQNHSLSIDFTKSEMVITPAVKRNHVARALPGEIIVRAKSLYGQLVVTDAYYRNQRVKVILDTGAAVTMGNVALRQLVSRHRDLKHIRLLSVTGTYLTADYTQIDTVKVGDVTFANLPIAFADAEPFRKFGLTTQPAIMLGMDSLRLFRSVKIDFANREVRFALPRNARVESDPRSLAL